MPDRDLSALIERVEQLSGPDREVDRDIALTFAWPVPYSANDDGAMVQLMRDCPAFTASVDAVLALVERVLPGWHWGITQGDKGDDAAAFQGNVWPGVQPFEASLEQFGYHAKPQHALLLALLRALRSRETVDGAHLTKEGG